MPVSIQRWLPRMRHVLRANISVAPALGTLANAPCNSNLLVHQKMMALTFLAARYVYLPLAIRSKTLPYTGYAPPGSIFIRARAMTPRVTNLVFQSQVGAFVVTSMVSSMPRLNL